MEKNKTGSMKLPAQEYKPPPVWRFMNTNISSTEIKNQQNSRQSSFFQVIPSRLSEDERLDPWHVVLFAHLTGLSVKEGYCFASDKYLSEKMRCSTSHIKRLIKTLEECGYIKRNTFYEGMKRIRHISILEAFSNNNCVGSHQTLPKDPTRPYVEVSPELCNKKSLIRKEREREHPPFFSSKKPYGEYERVLLSEGDHKKLLRLMGAALLSDVITRADEYMESHDKEYSNVVPFLTRLYKEDFCGKKFSRSSKEVNNTNKKFATEMKDRFEDELIRRGYKTEILRKSMLISHPKDPYSCEIYYSDKEFEEKLEDSLRKRLSDRKPTVTKNISHDISPNRDI